MQQGTTQTRGMKYFLFRISQMNFLFLFSQVETRLHVTHHIPRKFLLLKMATVLSRDKDLEVEKKLVPLLAFNSIPNLWLQKHLWISLEHLRCLILEESKSKADVSHLGIPTSSFSSVDLLHVATGKTSENKLFTKVGDETIQSGLEPLSKLILTPILKQKPQKLFGQKKIAVILSVSKMVFPLYYRHCFIADCLDYFSWSAVIPSDQILRLYNVLLPATI
ncbi:hypothetical protein EGR_07348 [Echinococcus granulosus]|uniref:Uncharacterized protein n=1 Tax=Echinococcus granulosus TaxID=6210 RepID=W6U9U0_ECHGR|nr:hypothetical protein EGR_07348 [Echinococcus granulosus]EUB57780.1 hypothetical protein EGR_07348 [Echinococcus granulosus]